MISTTVPRIVFVGEYNDWTSKWMYFDDESNSSLSRYEFGSYKLEHHRLEGVKQKPERFSRFIDASEFVVRFSKLRTMSGSGQHRFTYGKKTDALVIEGKVLDRDSHAQIYKKSFKDSSILESISKYGTNPFHLGHEDENFMLEITKGIIPIKSYCDPESYVYEKDENSSPSKMDYRTKELYDRSSGRAIVSVYNPEVWFPLGRVLTKCSDIMFNCICGMETPTFLKNMMKNKESNIRSNLEYLVNNIELAKNKYSEHIGLNGKILGLSDFLTLRDLIDRYYKSFDELNNKFEGKNWWADILEKSKDRLKSYGEEHVKRSPYYTEDPNTFSYADAFEVSRSAMHMTRGIEALWIAMNDRRFKDYDFYIIGYYGLDQQFLTPYLGDYLTEYQMLSDWIKSGKIKYLPEHIDRINAEYHSVLNKNKYPIFR